jgi:hypothetical protein
MYKKSKDGKEYLKYAKERNKSRFETGKKYEKEVTKLAKKKIQKGFTGL